MHSDVVRCRRRVKSQRQASSASTVLADMSVQQRISSLSVEEWPIIIGSFFILLAPVFPKGIPAFVMAKIARLKKIRSAGR